MAVHLVLVQEVVGSSPTASAKNKITKVSNGNNGKIWFTNICIDIPNNNGNNYIYWISGKLKR